MRPNDVTYTFVTGSYVRRAGPALLDYPRVYHLLSCVVDKKTIIFTCTALRPNIAYTIV